MGGRGCGQLFPIFRQHPKRSYQPGVGTVRLLITGVSPITMDDVTSGFNIGQNISLEANMNELFGFTEQEIRELLSYYQSVGAFSLDIEESMSLMKDWYSNYRFSEDAEYSIFNTDMVLYFVNKAIQTKKLPRNLIDQNVRIDYGKLRHLITLDQKLNGNFSRLKGILEKGEVEAEIMESFPLESLGDSDQFYSLLFYFGLLSLDRVEDGTSFLRIPNWTIRHLMYGYIRDALKDVSLFRVDMQIFRQLIRKMVYYGEWEAVFTFLAEKIEEQTGGPAPSIRDYLSEEKIIQGFLLAYLSITDYFLCWSEAEKNKGYGYLIELKYFQRGEKGSPKQLQGKIKKAKSQLIQYSQDKQLQQKMGSKNLTSLILVFHGWELIHQEKIT